ncbi:conserved hypothetical protein [Sporisorium reilianum SRZ2]|uniref:Uncharacterized protein n=1 Tax=Sporisorium reilianum (strain SRZ2) TaxID=999809 RepID=E6ZT37_SPORE|nr:conserved hypothetical protein [Sporisorium reilianum SRZ2]
MSDAQHPLLQWFSTAGIHLHPSLYLHQDPHTGLSFYTAHPLPANTTVISVPTHLCITSTSALAHIKTLLRTLCGSDVQLDPTTLPAADWTLLYLVLTRLAAEYLAAHPHASLELTKIFTHLAYVAHIPREITTPLHFSAAEAALLASTPLAGATERRLRETVVDYERARLLVSAHLAACQDGFGWFLAHALQPVTPEEGDALMAKTQHEGLELWRWAESAYTSRSFPPRLVGLDTATPILIPGYDTFNHARAHAVTWSTSAHTVDMTLNYAVPAACQVYNNYGGKSNEEFLAGYGFTLDCTSEDTLALKLAGVDGVTHYWRIPAPAEPTPLTNADGTFVEPACPAPALPADIRRSSVDPAHTPAQAYAATLELLEAMLLAKRKAFRATQRAFDDVPDSQLSDAACSRAAPHVVRKRVYADIAQYRKGQLELLNHAVKWTRDMLERVDEVLDAEAEAEEMVEDEQD